MFRTTPEKRLGPEEEEWTGQMHLLALLIEVTSITAAGRQIKKPIDIPRPGKKGKSGDPRERARQQAEAMDAQQEQQKGLAALGAPDPYKQGIAVLQRSAKPR